MAGSKYELANVQRYDAIIFDVILKFSFLFAFDFPLSLCTKPGKWMQCILDWKLEVESCNYLFTLLLGFTFLPISNNNFPVQCIYCLYTQCVSVCMAIVMESGESYIPFAPCIPMMTSTSTVLSHASTSQTNVVPTLLMQENVYFGKGDATAETKPGWGGEWW